MIPALVETVHGPVRGKTLQNSGTQMSAFFGIPYAAPPVGELRWRPPQDLRDWEDALECTEFGPCCPQPPYVEPWMGQPLGEMSEDCLSLNVWTPNASVDANLPVMVFIHGGAFISGKSGMEECQGHHLATRDVVVVSLNYRLGVFGFLPHPALSAESPDGISGNYGILDQIKGLQWVKENIRAFGGNPDSVTLFGQSAGAHSVALLMTSPKAQGLFHRVIIQSANIYKNLKHLKKNHHNEGSAEAMGERVAETLGYEGPGAIEKMRKIEVDALLEKVVYRIGLESKKGELFEPIVDGVILPLSVDEAIEQQKIAKVPVLLGTNLHEGSRFVAGGALAWGPYTDLFPSNYQTAQDFVRFTGLFGPFARSIRARFPITGDEDAQDAVIGMVTSLGYQAPARRFANSLTALGESVFLYQFTRSIPNGEYARLGAFHDAELYHVFSTYQDSFLRKDFYEDKDRELAEVMSRLWTNFAKQGTPNRDDTSSWPVWGHDTQNILSIGDEIGVSQHPHQERCDFVDLVGRVARTMDLMRRQGYGEL